MKTGDKVRFKHSKDEGVVRKINGSQVDVEISDGFIIPALHSELVIVASEEVSVKPDENNTDTVAEVKGLYLAFTPFNDRIYSILLINESNMEVLYSFGESREENYIGIGAGTIKARSSIKIGDALIKEFDSWPHYIIQAIFYKSGRSSILPPISQKLKIKAASFYKNKRKLPIVGTEGHIFTLDKHESNSHVNINPEDMFKSGNEIIEVNRPQPEIDLHIEKLSSDSSRMSGSEILSLQISTFEKNLENAMATGLDEITFIHGSGNGVLKKKLHEILSSNKSIVWFKEARKDKFGYGATLVRLK